MKSLNKLALAALAFVAATQVAAAFYDPSTARWINRDPIAERGDANLYRFVRNNAPGRVDPLGLRLWCEVWCDTRVFDLLAIEPWPSCDSGFAIGSVVIQKGGLYSNRLCRCIPLPWCSTRKVFMFRRCVPSGQPILPPV